MVKYNSDGETWLEKAPFYIPELAEEEEEEEKEEVREEGKERQATPVSEKPISQPQATLPEARRPCWPEIKRVIQTSAARHPRSVSFSYKSPPIPRRGGFGSRRMSMHISMLRRKGATEEGSPQFLQAMKEDSQHETHPGWDSIRRLVALGVVG